MQELLSRLAALGISITPEFNGTIQRNGSQWCIGSQVLGRKIANYGCFKQDFHEEWIQGAGESITPEENLAFIEARAKQKAQAQRAKEENWVTVAAELERDYWSTVISADTYPYLLRKGITGLYGAKIMETRSGPGILIVPMRDLDGKLWNLQRIYAEKLSLGDKFFAPGAKIKGLSHRLGKEPTDEGSIYIVEGFATGCSVFKALGENASVYVAFNAGNLKPTAEALYLRYPRGKIVVCADNDTYTKRPDGSAYNPGLEKGREAAETCSGQMVYPTFKAPREGLTDFNDLHQVEGVETVKEQLLNQPKQDGEGPKAQATPAAKEKVTEVRIAQLFLTRNKEPLIRQGKSIFRYNGKFWEELNDWDIDQLKNQLNNICSSALDSKKVNSIYSTFFRMLDHVPEDTNLFVPNPKCGNFLDGTLRLNRNEKTGLYCLSFSEHRKEDYLTWAIPVSYNCDKTIKNSRWEKLLEEALEGEPDKEGMLRSLKQMGGAMLVPAFPQLFFLFGLSGSRKSTIALTLEKLLDKKNVSSCDPSRMDNFEIEGMIGKLVNLHTDIDDHTPLPRGFLKRFEDQTEVQVNRKGKPVVRAKLPAIHVYCANELPPNMEQGKAFQRRLTLLEFKNDRTNEPGANVIRRYEELIWAEGYQGILNWCLEGLTDLVAMGGKFFVPGSSQKAVQDWQAERDPLELFMRDVKAGVFVDGQTQMFMGPEHKIERKLLWANFIIWYKDTFNSVPKIGRTRFYAQVIQSGFGVIPYNGVREFRGIGVKIDPNSTH